MAAEDFLTNVETAFLSLFAANPILQEYNWERWDSDKEIELPRGMITISAISDPNETPYNKLTVVLHFEGRPKKQKLSVVVNELKSLLTTKNTTDLDAACNNTVQFMGHAISVMEDRQVAAGLRTWKFGFVIYALPMV